MAIPVRKRQPTGQELLANQLRQIQRRAHEPLATDNEAAFSITRKMRRLHVAASLQPLQAIDRAPLTAEEMAQKRIYIEALRDDAKLDSIELPAPSAKSAYPMPIRASVSRLALKSRLDSVLAEIVNPPTPEPSPSPLRQIVETGEGTLTHAEYEFYSSAPPEIQALFADCDSEREVVMQASLYRRYKDDPAFDDYLAGRQLIVVAG
jgi:hypothetical protein